MSELHDFFLRFLLQEEDWMEKAACNGKPSEWFFPKRGQPTANGRECCASCPVKQACSDYADRTGSEGLWAGRMRTYVAKSLNEESNVKSA